MQNGLNDVYSHIDVLFAAKNQNFSTPKPQTLKTAKKTNHGVTCYRTIKPIYTDHSFFITPEKGEFAFRLP